MAEFSVVGQRVPRVDAPSKVTGAAVYSGDVILPNMLHGKVLRSPHPHAAIRCLDVTKAQCLEGVMAVITAEDVPGYKNKSTLLLNELPHIAKDKVVYAEQPVAVVAAASAGRLGPAQVEVIPGGVGEQVLDRGHVARRHGHQRA